MNPNPSISVQIPSSPTVITPASTTLQQCVHTAPQVAVENHIKLPNIVRKKIKHFKAKVFNDIETTCNTLCCIPPLSHTPQLLPHKKLTQKLQQWRPLIQATNLIQSTTILLSQIQSQTMNHFLKIHTFSVQVRIQVVFW